MRILIVAENPGIHPYLQSLDGPGTHHIVQYNHPLKALDNLAEIDPQIILWSNDDFPRHWKICLSYVADRNPPVDFYLMSDNPLPKEEAAKAETLGVAAVFAEGFFAEDVTDLFASIADSSPPSSDDAPESTEKTPHKRQSASGTHTDDELENADLLTMLSPKTAVIVAGTVLSTTSREIVVELPNEKRIAEFDAGALIEYATIAGEGLSVQAVLRVAEKPVSAKLRLSLVELR